MKKLFSIILSALLICSFVGCANNVEQNEWQICSVNEQEFRVLVNSEKGYEVKSVSESFNLFDFYKDNEKICGNAGFVTDISKESIDDIAKVGKILKERKEDGVTYLLYEDISEDSAATHFIIAYIKEKNAIFTFETNGNVEEFKKLFDNFKIS